MVRNYILILLLTIAAGGWALNHCEAAFGAQATKTTEGRIVAIDTFKSIITVKSLVQYPNIAYKEILLFVGPDAKMMKSSNVLSIFDLNIGNSVTVKYIEEPIIPDTLVSMIIST